MKKLAVVLCFVLATLITVGCGSATATVSLQPTSTPMPSNAIKVENFMITLNFAYGARSGRFTGYLVDGVPDGFGVFVSSNNSGNTWTYTGNFSKGHFKGEGMTVWLGGVIMKGLHENDILINGEHLIYGKLLYSGAFSNGVYNGIGTLYDMADNVIFSGLFDEGYLVETPDVRTTRATKLASQVTLWTKTDYTNCMTNEAPFLGKLIEINGKVARVFENKEPYDASVGVIISMDGDKKYLIELLYQYGNLERKLKAGNTVKIYGVISDMYRFVQNGKDLKMPLMVGHIIIIK